MADVPGISGASLNGISGVSSNMSIQTMAALVMLEVSNTKKEQAQSHIEEMQAKNNRAKEIPGTSAIINPS